MNSVFVNGGYCVGWSYLYINILKEQMQLAVGSWALGVEFGLRLYDLRLLRLASKHMIKWRTFPHAILHICTPLKSKSPLSEYSP